MSLKQLFYGIGIMVVLYSCRTEKIEVCENEENLLSIDNSIPTIELDTLLGLPSDGSSICIATTLLQDYFHLEKNIFMQNRPHELNLPFNIAEGKDTFKCIFQQRTNFCFRDVSSIDVLVNFKDDVYVEDSKAPEDSIQCSVMKVLMRDSLDFPYQFYVDWDRRSSKKVVLKTLKEVKSIMKNYFELKSKYQFKKLICDLDSAEFQKLKPNQFRFTFENSPPPPPPPIIEENEHILNINLDSLLLN